jgi:NCS1 family nucleobase:cation symporter-1
VNVKALPPESVPPFLAQLYNYAWFIGFAVAFAIYLALRKLTSSAQSAKQ